ncbi:thiamine pyrophosphate-binding protein [Sulfitobacter sp. LCG007]
MTDRPLGAQISHMLKTRGVEVIFGIPGVHNQEMYRGIEDAGIRHVLARHEQGAGFMADGYARASGKPGVAYVITGPGLCNIMTPMGQAYSDSVPLLVISSCLDETAARRGQLHQMLDQRAAGASVCEWSEEARSPRAAYALIDRALTEFETRRRRPKHLMVPIRLLEGDGGDFPDAPSAQEARLMHARIDDETVAQVARRLMQAERPLAVFGGGAAQAAGPAREVLAKARMASFMTAAGRGIAAAEDPLCFGSCLARAGSEEIFASADAVLLVGTDLAEVDLWRERAGHQAPAIIVNVDPEVLAAGSPQDLLIPADATDFLGALSAALQGTPASGWQPGMVADRRERWRVEVAAEYPDVLEVADALREALPDETMIYSDMTQIAYAALEAWDMALPGHWHHPFGFGTLGYALPAAIGGAVARPGRPTLAIAGDYGLQYTLPELGAAVELGLPLPVVVWDNGKLGAIEASMVRAQIAPNAVVARNPDFCRLAEAYGARAARPRSLDDLREAVAAAFGADRPTLIHVTPDVLGQPRGR